MRVKIREVLSRMLIKMISEPISKDDCLMTFEEWEGGVKCTAYTDDDGYGYWSDGEVKFVNLGRVYPSDWKAGKWKNNASHIVWYNK